MRGTGGTKAWGRLVCLLVCFVFVLFLFSFSFPFVSFFLFFSLFVCFVLFGFCLGLGLGWFGLVCLFVCVVESKIVKKTLWCTSNRPCLSDAFMVGSVPNQPTNTVSSKNTQLRLLLL